MKEVKVDKAKMAHPEKSAELLGPIYPFSPVRPAPRVTHQATPASRRSLPIPASRPLSPVGPHESFFDEHDFLRVFADSGVRDRSSY